MKDHLKEETEKLARSWSQHEPGWLRDYLVASVEDPRVNQQSILSRHFVIRAIVGGHFEVLMAEEHRFAVAMDWLYRITGLAADEEGREVVLYALRKGADNAEGLEIPSFITQTFQSLPATIEGCAIPNYLEQFLEAKDTHATVLETFAKLWRDLLTKRYGIAEQNTGTVDQPAGDFEPAPRVSVVEPACGSANDYRFVHQFGLAALIDYTGFDLCRKNVENARSLFPEARIEEGNVFEINAPSKSYDLCIVHDLLEHLSIAGMEQAVEEICRVSRAGICVGYFQMDEMADHIVRPVEEYHWNRLSTAKMEDLFGAFGFATQCIHIGSFLREQFDWTETHNPNAYTFYLRPV